MIKILLALSIFFYALANANIINGSGASFPYSVYQQWLKTYNKETGVRINYSKKGSSKGIKDAKKRAVDFAGTDKPLSPKILKKNGLYQFPSIMGAIILGYNLPNIKGLKLSRQAIVGIVHGDVRYWDDPIISKNNPNLQLPHKELTFIHRADGSGTTYNFTYYLSKISKKWRREFGAKKSLGWPGTHHIGAKTNSGVTALIQQMEYSIGYIDYSDAKNNTISMAAIENRAGKFITPTLYSFGVAVSMSSLEPKQDFYRVIADPKGEESYPIVTASFILLPSEKLQTNQKIIKFYNWCYTQGQSIAKDLGYVPIPEVLYEKILLYWSRKNIPLHP